MTKLIELSEYVDWEDENGDVIQIKRRAADIRLYQKLVQKLGFNPKSLIGKTIQITILEQIQGEGENQFYIDTQWIGSTIKGYKISTNHEYCDLGLNLDCVEKLKIFQVKQNDNDNDSFTISESDPEAYLNWIGIIFDFVSIGSTIEWSAQLTTRQYNETLDIDIILKIDGLE